MNLSIDELFFFPDDVHPDDTLLNNRRCIRLALAWLQSGDVVEDGAQWLVDCCAYQELPTGQETAALCTGYLQLYKALSRNMQPDSITAQQLKHALLTQQTLQLGSISGGLQEYPELRMLLTLRDTAESLRMGSGITERQLYLRAVIDYVLPAEWLSQMADAQRTMWLEGSEEAAEQIGELWQYMFNILLPESMQTAYFCENCLRGTYFALCTEWASEAHIWRDITESFINTIETE